MQFRWTSQRPDQVISLYCSLLCSVQRNTPAVEFLLDCGADVGVGKPLQEAHTGLAGAVAAKKAEIVAMLLDRGASISGEVEDMDIVEWASLNCRNIYSLLKENLEGVYIGVTIGDLVHAANQGSHTLHAYVNRHQGRITSINLSKGLLNQFD